jgi:hypothetical protein
MDFRDNGDIELQQQDFGREHFRKLIKKTFDDYYPLEYNKSTFNMDDYLEVVSREQLQAKFSIHLEVNDDNILTLKNMPWLDMGDLPVSYKTSKSEAFQVFLVPHDELPFTMVVTYENWPAKFDDAKLRRDFDKTQLQNKGLTVEDVEDTLQRATELIQDYRGVLAKRGKIIKIILFTMGAILLFLAVLIGMMDQGNYWAPMLLIIFYLLTFLMIVTINKYRSSNKMRMSQFLLSVFCRAENNRLYLKQGVEVRPGFLGKWIEFTSLENNEVDSIVTQMRQRFLKPCLE